MDRYLNAELILAAAGWIVCTGLIDVPDSLLDPQRQQQLDLEHLVMPFHHIRFCPNATF